MRKPLIAAVILAIGLAAPALAHDGHDHVHGHHGMGAEDHHHDAPHGGVVRTVQPYHFELVSQPKQTLVYLLDENLKTLPTKGRTGEIVLQAGGKTQKAKFTAAGNAFAAPLSVQGLDRYVAVVSLTIDGKTHRARFAHPAPHGH